MYTVYPRVKTGKCPLLLGFSDLRERRAGVMRVPHGLNELANCGTGFMKQGDTQIGLTENE